MAQDDALRAVVRKQTTAIKNLYSQVTQLVTVVNALQSKPTSTQEEIDDVPGRRMEGVLSGEVTFDTTDIGKRANPIIFQISQDGPFVMTHYPLVLWRPTAPSNTTNLNRWRPVSSFPLPTQQVTTDIIDIMYELQDGGSQRNMQNAPRSVLLSRPDNIVPCPVPTLFSSNTSIAFTPIYLSMTFNSAVPPTQGTLHVDLVGYRIFNL